MKVAFHKIVKRFSRFSFFVVLLIFFLKPYPANACFEALFGRRSFDGFRSLFENFCSINFFSRISNKLKKMTKKEPKESLNIYSQRARQLAKQHDEVIQALGEWNQKKLVAENRLNLEKNILILQILEKHRRNNPSPLDGLDIKLLESMKLHLEQEMDELLDSNDYTLLAPPKPYQGYTRGGSR
jgi:hypothetical protein